MTIHPRAMAKTVVKFVYFSGGLHALASTIDCMAVRTLYAVQVQVYFMGVSNTACILTCHSQESQNSSGQGLKTQREHIVYTKYDYRIRWAVGVSTLAVPYYSVWKLRQAKMKIL